jgi:hypothetical protein
VARNWATDAHECTRIGIFRRFHAAEAGGGRGSQVVEFRGKK